VTVPGREVPPILWQPSEEVLANAGITRYLQWLEQKRGLKFDGYNELWQWSVDHLEEFWGSLWEFFEIKASVPYDHVLIDEQMPGARWFSGARLNFAEHALRQGDSSKPAIVFTSENGEVVELSWTELRHQVAALASSLQSMGIQSGDRVVGYLPNIPEAVVAFLASASIGAVWSVCGPDFGIRSVVDRFRQLEPKVLIAADGYRYGGRDHDRREVLTELVSQLPSLRHVVFVDYLGMEPPQGMDHEELCRSKR
jgi:Acyl-coenzyme A synthetases/AMP-(fatty) acid ligases